MARKSSKPHQCQLAGPARKEASQILNLLVDFTPATQGKPLRKIPRVIYSTDSWISVVPVVVSYSKEKKKQEYIPEDMAGLFKKVSEPKIFEDVLLEDDIVTQFNISLCEDE